MKDKKFAIQALKSTINLICPPRCINCNKIISNAGCMCSKCWSSITFISSNCCKICGLKANISICPQCQINEKHQIIKRHAIIYNQSSSKLFKKFKFYNSPYLAKNLSKLVINAIRDIANNVDLIMPVPMTNIGIILRGYNQSLLLAKEIANYYKINLDHKSLIKKRQTKKQTSLKTIEQRKKNISNAFLCKNESKTQNKTILLVDDIYTTGSTLNECKKAIKTAKEIRFATLGYSESYGVKNF